MGKQNMYEHTIGVPFIISGPGIPKDKRSQAQIYLRDMFPTTCELAGIRQPKTVHGRSLVPILRGTATRTRSAIFGYFYDRQRMIRTDKWKLIHYPQLDKYQLFDLQNDPHELTNLADHPQHAATQRSLTSRMNGWFNSATR